MSGFGLLGEHLGHSFSPKIHGLLGDYPYGLSEVAPEGLADFLRTTTLEGMNVTIPYKKAVIPFCTELSPAARAIGSVNTLLRRGGGWYGENTDAFGFRYLLERRGCAPAGKRCAVLGTGGASLTVQTVLRELGAERVSVLSRSGRNDYAHLAEYADTEILVNATPVGMFPDNGVSPVPASAFPALEAAIDLIYNPRRTAFLLQVMQQTSPERRIVTENGLPMLVAQAARAAELFTGESVSRERIELILCKLERESENLILIGMPGCGKTVIGRKLAAALGREFVDSDAVLTEVTGKSPEQWIVTEGEAAFRAAETEIFRKLGKRAGIVLACGGGAVTRPENEALLRQNGRILWIRRELCKLETAGRPLSAREGIETLYRRRAPLYARFADLTADNNGTAEETLERILEVLEA